MKAKRFILDAVKSEGLDFVFMVPGGLVEPFISEFGEQHSGVEAIVAAQEGGAAYMADGFARASGRFGVCMAIGGPGVANAVPALAAAHADQSPVLLISGQVQTDWEGRGAFQDASPAGLNDIEILRPLVAYAEEVRRVEDIPHHLHVALRQALGYVRGPVCVAIPKEMQDEELDAEYHALPPSITKAPRFVVEGGVQWAVDVLAKAGSARIAILAGHGSARSGATGELVAFAEEHHVPVATTLRAKGVFPEDHPLSLGVFGYAGTRWATRGLLGVPDEGLRADALLVLGSSLNQRDTMLWSKELLPRDALVQVDVNPSSFGRNFPSDVQVTGDVSTALRSFMDHGELLSLLADTRSTREEWVQQVISGDRRYDADTRTSDAVPLHPARVITDLRRVAPRDTVVLVDSGAHRAFAGHHWDSYGPGQYVSSTTMAPMGWAIPAAIGAKLARPDLPCVAITGDGCMLMNGIEVQTAAHHDVPVIYLVLNNGALGNVWLRAVNDEARELTTLGMHDWVGFARSLGADGVRVEKPEELEGAFEQAFASKSTFVLDVRTDVRFKTPITPWSEAKKGEGFHSYLS